MTQSTRKYGSDTDGRFKLGNSGRPKGARNKATVSIEALLEGEAEAITRKIIDLALEGNITAIRLCMDRIAPARKGAAVRVDLPQVNTLSDLRAGQLRIAEAMASGFLSPEEAADASKVLENIGASLERRDLEKRLEALENQTRDK